MKSKTPEQIKDEVKDQIKEEQVWLLTYADMMTLLFAFFVLLYSMSSPDPVKASQLSEGMKEALGMTDKNETVQTQSDINETIKEIIEDLNIEEHANVSRDPRGVSMEIEGDICFPSGSTVLNDTLKKILNLARQNILNNDKDYRLVIIEGHTDADPIPEKLKEYYPTNWELSSARASKVVNYLIDIGVNSGKLQASGYADRWPASVSWSKVRGGLVTDSLIIEQNKTIAQKKINRRIKIIFSNN